MNRQNFGCSPRRNGELDWEQSLYSITYINFKFSLLTYKEYWKNLDIDLERKLSDEN